MTFGVLLRTELVLQRRGGFWGAYAVVAVAYLAVLAPLPDEVVDRVLPVLVFSDPAVLGLFVVGALVLLERREGVLQGLAHAPVSPMAWIGAKVAAITLLASGVALVVAGGSGALVRPELLLLAVVPTSATSVLVGLAVVSRTATFNRFLATISVVTIPLAVPAVELLFGASWSWARWLPTGPAAELLRGALGEPVSAEAIVRDVGVMAASTGLAAWWASAWTRRYLWRRT